MAEYCNDHFKMVEDTDDSFRMWQGLVGPCYTPVMSNDGTLSWTNNGNLPNPEAVNIRGPQGAGIRIAGIVETESSLPSSAADGAIWLVGEGSPYEGYAWVNGTWIDLGPLTVGPAGPPGPQGDDYELTEADKQEIAEISESILLTELDNEPLGVRYGGTGARTVEGAKQMLGIDEITDKLGTWPLGTDAQDVAGAINEMIGEIDLQVADIEQLKNNFAGEFSPTSTYTVGTYVVYDGAFWRCTTAVTTAGSWTGNSNWTQVTAGGELKTANTNISTLASDISTINTALSGKVSKSGDTMTGNLTVATSGASSRVDAKTGTDNKASLYSNAEGGNLRLEKGLAHAEMDTNSMNSAGTGAVRLYLNDGTATEVTKQFLFKQDGSFTDGNGVNTGTLNSEKVSKSGDTMTGDLQTKSSNIEINELSNAWGNASVYLNDKNNARMASIRAFHFTNGMGGIQIGGHNGSTENVLRLMVNSSGERSVGVSDSAAWRSALGIEPYSINNSVATFTEDITGTNTRIIIKNRTVIANYQGESKTHAAGDTLFTFNSGYRPGYLFYVPFVINNTGYGVLSINSDGAVKVSTINGGTTAGRIYAQFTFPLA